MIDKLNINFARLNNKKYQLPQPIGNRRAKRLRINGSTIFISCSSVEN
ncbi:MAG: hypothetical protein OJF59_000274 [Cytophagales bacterium]|jgi:hypothetical protein|nr:MAG: hypothetical protein OJF59_000274 [Cytophagales bacterium]